MMNVIGYTRVSTDGQVGEDKFGLEVQKQAIIEYCSEHDMNIVEWFTDEGESGAKERPGFDKIIYDDQAVSNPPYEAVVVWKSDRVARDINIYYYYKMMLKKKDIKLISIKEDFGQFGVFASMLEAFTLCVAEMERENITKRTSAGRNMKAVKGGYAGGRPPLGYRVENHDLRIVPEEAEIVKFIYRARKAGQTMKDITDSINKLGYRTRSNKEFCLSTIQSILNNERFYRGEYKYGDSTKWVKGEHEPIL